MRDTQREIYVIFGAVGIVLGGTGRYLSWYKGPIQRCLLSVLLRVLQPTGDAHLWCFGCLQNLSPLSPAERETSGTTSCLL